MDGSAPIYARNRRARLKSHRVRHREYLVTFLKIVWYSSRASAFGDLRPTYSQVPHGHTQVSRWLQKLALRRHVAKEASSILCTH